MSAIQNLELNLQLKLELIYISDLLCFDNIFKAKAKHLQIGKKAFGKNVPKYETQGKKTCLTCGNISFLHDGKNGSFWDLLQLAN
jgi:hypothetical protein